MPFLPDWNHWVSSHIVYIPRETAAFCGDLSGVTMLDVGCGDMIADMGLLNLGVKHIIGIDVLVRDWDVKETAARCVREAGFDVPANYASRLTYMSYDGRAFPFPDDSFDFVFSWSAFEHIPDVPALLREVRRVTKPLGRVFLQVYPWFPSYWGSHIADFIAEPFFHLTRSPEWVSAQLEAYVDANPAKRDLVLKEMWPEYQSLNRYSAYRLMRDVMEVGFAIEKSYVTINEEHVASIPEHVPISDAISVGSMLLLCPAKTLTREEIHISRQRA
jgi:ubiquinone/menaquinone biosynthesis C-methylase UbiE